LDPLADGPAVPALPCAIDCAVLGSGIEAVAVIVGACAGCG
jgi:hypothetical protein